MTCTRPSIHDRNFESKVVEASGTFVADISIISSMQKTFNDSNWSISFLNTAVAFLAELRRLSVQESEIQSPQDDDWTQAVWQIPIAHRKLAAIPSEQRLAYQQKTAQLYHAYEVLCGAAAVPSTIITTEGENTWRIQDSKSYCEILCGTASVYLFRQTRLPWNGPQRDVTG